MMPRIRFVSYDRPVIAWFIALVGVSALVCVLAASGGASPPRDDTPVVEKKWQRVGMNSCSARGCHGAVDSVDPAAGNVYIKGGASTTWLHYDPHARAYDVLRERRSEKIAELLKGPLEGKKAHEAKLCLSCHATVSPPEPIREGVASVTDGVSCESCHGPAEVWQTTHLATGWMQKPASEKSRDGMTDLSTASGRAQTCVGCHVGDRSRGMDMNHDLIAAGHPRLNFEYSSYLAAYPKHWKEKSTDRADFEAKSWAIGQLVTARAVLRLMADRAIASKDGFVRIPPAPVAIWPELSEYECFSCHHELTKGSTRQSKGQLPWATWPLAMVPDLAKAGNAKLGLDGLRTEVTKIDYNPDEIAKKANETIKALDKLIAELESGKLDKAKLAPVLESLNTLKPDPLNEWDLATQVYLAKQAMIRAGVLTDDPATKETTLKSLMFEGSPLYDSPRRKKP